MVVVGEQVKRFTTAVDNPTVVRCVLGHTKNPKIVRLIIYMDGVYTITG